MPTKTVKKSSSKARKPAAKSAAKKKAAVLAKPAVRKAKKAAPAPVQHGHQGKRGFMWKLLEEKRARQMQGNGGKPMNSANPFERGQLPTGVNQQGFGRFNGPRRKAA